LEEVCDVVDQKQPRIVAKLDDATSVVRATNRLLHQVAACMRQLVCVSGWLTLLVGGIGLLIHPHFSPAHLLVPGAGALAVLQSTIRPLRKQPEESSPLEIDELFERTNAQLFPNEDVPADG
jgi:hypothetical protein